MYVTYVVRPREAPEGKGPQFQPFWDQCMDYNLRGGFAMQLAGYIIVLISSAIGGNVLEIFGVLSGRQAAVQHTPILLVFLGTFLWTFGSVWIQNFRNIADDDASICQTRGFRAGIKCLHQASLLELLSFTMTTVLSFSLMSYFEDSWASKKAGSGSIVIFSSIARVLHSVSLMLYAASFFLLENFHAQGTAEIWGWIIAILYKVAGISGLVGLIMIDTVFATVANVVFTLSLGAALLSALMWSLMFEPLVNSTDVKLTQSAMRNEFYKSKNAMAYYGPPVGVELVNQD